MWPNDKNHVTMPNNNPIAEVFGFPVSNLTENAKYFRENRLCPYHNRFPNCTKDKADDPLGVCSVNHGEHKVITCPSRFREDWKILHNAASFVWPKEKANIAWFLYDLEYSEADQRYHLVLVDTIYTEFQAALEQVIYTKPGQMADFLALLQGKLDERISNEPETRSVYDLL